MKRSDSFGRGCVLMGSPCETTPARPPKGRWTRFVCAAAAAFLLVCLAIPSTPLYAWLWQEWSADYYEGHFLNHWIAALNDDDGMVRCEAATALGAIGPKSPEVVPTLCKVLRDDPQQGPRIEASLALLKIATASPESVRQALSTLGQALRDPAPMVRMNATLTLLRLGKAARAVLPELSVAMFNPNNRLKLGVHFYTIREWAALAIGRATAGTDDAVPILLAALEEAHVHEMRYSAVRALGEVGPAARAAIPNLHAMLEDDDTHARQVAREALDKIEGEVAAPPRYAPAG